jgi:hypothetical protein
MSAAHDLAAAHDGLVDGTALDIFHAPKEVLAGQLGGNGQPVRPIHLLQYQIGHVAEPCKPGMVLEERIEGVPVSTEHRPVTAFEYVAWKNLQTTAQTTAQLISGAVMIANDTDDMQPGRQSPYGPYNRLRPARETPWGRSLKEIAIDD